MPFSRCPRGLKNKLKAIAEPLVAGIDPEGPDGITARARALEAFLRDSGQFSYTLQMAIVDSKLDPVEDFLVNRKAGHCEYFASALALLVALRRHPISHGQRLQGRRLEPTDQNLECPPETRS